ncbi:histidine phosphatase family protein [Cellulomonas sp. URHD0024]|uniref:histidine phosphatase family protein n=1 Tax=Cellulomonas sp. URHD0024 TaxID=1302620 RepID=UPI0004132D0F|nr:histidine phosphatase family protein [Cellulomonas sp. URHD0024]
MTAGRLLLVRHGRTAYNSQARLQGQVDIPLDEVGRWQARTAVALLLARHEPTVVVTSDLTRAHETARFVARAAGLDLLVDPRLRERGFGVWEGLTGDDLRRDWADEFAVWRAGGQPEGVGAETRAEVAARTSEGIREHVAALGRDDTLVVVSHGSAISSAVGALLGMPEDWHGFSGMHNAHWTELIATRGDIAPAWRMVGYNLGPTDASSDWNAGPDSAHDADSETRDPD